MTLTSIRILFLLLIAANLRAQAPELTSGSVADAAQQLTGRAAHMNGGIHLIAGTRLAGPAVTLGLVRDDKAPGMPAALAVIQLLESAPAGSVVVTALDDEKSFAVFGSTFTALAKARNLAGLVVDGSVRDL